MLKSIQAPVRICRIELSIENGVSSPQKIEYAFIKPFIQNLEDLKFADDTELIVAGHGKCEIQSRLEKRLLTGTQASFHLLGILYNKKTESADGLTYSTASEVIETNLRDDILSNVSHSPEERIHIRHTFPKGPEWAPEKIEINGRKGRRIICVLAKDKINYRIYDIDNTNESDSRSDAMD